MMNVIEKYRKQAVLHGERTREGDSNRANAAHDKLIELATTILNSAEPQALTTLLSDEDVWVQLWAATHSLEVNETDASIKLRELSGAGLPLASMSARYTLEAWDKGELRVVSKNSNDPDGQ